LHEGDYNQYSDFQKDFLVEGGRAVARGPSETGTFDAQGIAAGKSPIGGLRSAPDSKSRFAPALTLWSLATGVQRDRCLEAGFDLKRT